MLGIVVKLRLTLLLLLVLFLGLATQPIKADQMTDRSLELASSITSVSTDHDFTFDLISTDIVGSIEFEYCSNDAFPGAPCTAPSGFDISSATLDAQTGETGFSVHPNTTTNRMILSRSPSAVTPGAVNYDLGGVINPDSEGSYYVRLATFASNDGTGARIDEGAVAFSINSAVSVDAYVPPILTFCVGVSISGTNCASASGSSINFGVLDPETTRFATTQMVIGTNAGDGYTITASGTTMTSGNNTIGALASQSPSSTGKAQFGINLVANALPSVGANPAGDGTGVADSDYDDANFFRYINGDRVALSTTSSDFNKYTVSYIVNVPESQAPGVYTTTITYIALASF